MKIDQIGVLLSLLVSILGWSVTAYYQKKLLERQIQAEEDREVRKYIISRKVQQLEEIKEWLEEGYRLWSVRDHLPYRGNISEQRILVSEQHRLDNEISEWASRYGSISTMVRLLEKLNEKPCPEESEQSLGWMISRMYLNMPTVNLAYDEDSKFSDNALQMYLDYFELSIKKVECIIEMIIHEN